MSEHSLAADLIALDERSRSEALDLRRSLLLQAPAGSGKTSVLTARFLTLLTDVEAPEEILAITFTRKAAAHMRQQILAALQGADDAAPPPGIDRRVLQALRQRDRERGWELTHNPARLRVETIDALNHWLARALSVSAGSAPSLRIAEAPMTLYRLAARRCLKNAWVDQEACAAAECLSARLDDDWPRLEQLLADMLACRSHWLPPLLRAADNGLAQCVRDSLDSVLRTELALTLARLPASLLTEGAQILAHTHRALRRTQSHVLTGSGGTQEGPLTADPACVRGWRALCDLALTAKGWRRRFTQQQGFESDDRAMKRRAELWAAALAAHPGTEELLRRVQALPDAELSSADEAALEALALLLRRAAAELQIVFAAHGRVDYAYVAGAARASLTEQGEPSDFALRTGNAVRHILVDEFQDTSYEQFELLRAMTAGWSRGDGRTLFLVGDPMQSIYQFREAEVALFLRARDYGIGELTFESLQLRRNFRARSPLIAWINERFARLFPVEDNARLAAIRYLPSLSADAALPGGALLEREASAIGIQVHRFEPGDQNAEARRVLEIIREVRAREPAASIAVLVASREHAARIVALLREAGVSVRGVDLEPLRDRPVIRDLASLTRVLLHGADRSAWLALLRAPWCGLTLAQLDALCAQDQGDLFAPLRALTESTGGGGEEEALRARLSRLCAALEPALEGAERNLPLWQRVERCWLRLSGPAICSRELDRLDAHRFLDALALHDNPEALAGEALGEITEGLYSAAPAQPGAIEIMTMHAAKGLEWDVVILPGLGRKTASDTDPLLHWIDLPRAGAGTDLLLCPIRATERELPGSLAAFIKRLRRDRARIERVRLLYVAATRARSAVHLLGALKASASHAGAPTAPAGSLLQVLWPALAQDFLSAPVVRASAASQSQAKTGAPERPQEPLWRLPAHWSLPRPPPPPALERLRFSCSAPEPALEYSWVGLTARAVGTIVHAELRRLALARALPEAAEALRQLPHYGSWLTELGVAADELPAARARIALALQRTLADARGRWLLSGAHRQAHSEWRLTGLLEGRVQSVVFDRMLLDEQGQRWIVDFKTSMHEGAGEAQFIDSEVQRYRAQLQRYAALARELGPEPVRVALYFPLLSVFRELPLLA